jgi:hypothetical protein
MYLEGQRKTTKISFRIASVPAEIRSENFPNRILEPYL